MIDRKPDRITILSGFSLPFHITSTVFSRSVIMIIPMPAEYLDQLYTEIGLLLFLISLFLLILFLCTVIRFHTKKKAFSEHDSQIRKLNEQLQTLASLNAISFVQKLMIIRTKLPNGS